MGLVSLTLRLCGRRPVIRGWGRFRTKPSLTLLLMVPTFVAARCGSFKFLMIVILVLVGFRLVLALVLGNGPILLLMMNRGVIMSRVDCTRPLLRVTVRLKVRRSVDFLFVSRLKSRNALTFPRLLPVPFVVPLFISGLFRPRVTRTVPVRLLMVMAVVDGRSLLLLEKFTLKIPWAKSRLVVLPILFVMKVLVVLLRPRLTMILILCEIRRWVVTRGLTFFVVFVRLVVLVVRKLLRMVRLILVRLTVGGTRLIIPVLVGLPVMVKIMMILIIKITRRLMFLMILLKKRRRFRLMTVIKMKPCVVGRLKRRILLILTCFSLILFVRLKITLLRVTPLFVTVFIFLRSNITVLVKNLLRGSCVRQSIGMILVLKKPLPLTLMTRGLINFLRLRYVPSRGLLFLMTRGQNRTGVVLLLTVKPIWVLLILRFIKVKTLMVIVLT